MDRGSALEVEWQCGENELQVTVWGRFVAAEQRRMDVRYLIDDTKNLIELSCYVQNIGKVFHHDSVLRGFCQIPLQDLQGLDPDACDWRTVLRE